MAHRRFALGIQYDGSAWQGWQSQPDGLTVQDRLEAALSQFANQPIATICAGRTDAGVHALGQVVHFDSDALRSDEGWVRGTNALLPPSIAVRWVRSVPPEFHARFDALSRTYDYWLVSDRIRNPLLVGRYGWTHAPLDLAAMQAASRYLLGEHDFSAFRSAQCQAKNPVRQLHRLDIAARSGAFRFQLEANAFLHHMVRNLVGALVYVGRHRHPPQWAHELLMQRDRRLAAPTFMPDGLYLRAVRYPTAYNLPSESPLPGHLD